MTGEDDCRSQLLVAARDKLWGGDAGSRGGKYREVSEKKVEVREEEGSYFFFNSLFRPSLLLVSLVLDKAWQGKVW